MKSKNIIYCFIQIFKIQNKMVWTRKANEYEQMIEKIYTKWSPRREKSYNGKYTWNKWWWKDMKAI